VQGLRNVRLSMSERRHKMQHFTNEQIMSEIEAFAQGW